MTTGPILEEWLLSGKATVKNISVGGGGLTQIPVPEGKTYIITSIEILPFVNIISYDNYFAQGETFYKLTTQELDKILARTQFQLVFYNNRTNSIYNVRNEFYFNTYEGSGAATNIAPGLKFEKQKFETFHIVETNSWLFLKYIDFVLSPPTYSASPLNLIFDGSENWPPSPFFGWSDQTDTSELNSSYGPSFDYAPKGYNGTYLPNFNNDTFLLPSVDQSSTDPGQNTAWLTPTMLGSPNSTTLSTRFNNSMPFYNIQVIEINKRLSTNLLL